MQNASQHQKLETFVGSLHAFLPGAADFRRAFHTEVGQAVPFPLVSAGCVAVEEAADVDGARWRLLDQRQRPVATLRPPQAPGERWQVDFEA